MGYGRSGAIPAAQPKFGSRWTLRPCVAWGGVFCMCECQLVDGWCHEIAQVQAFIHQSIPRGSAINVTIPVEKQFIGMEDAKRVVDDTQYCTMITYLLGTVPP